MIESWVLILLVGTQGLRGVSIATVPGFASQAECQRVAATWNDTYTRQSAICIRGPDVARRLEAQ